MTPVTVCLAVLVTLAYLGIEIFGSRRMLGLGHAFLAGMLFYLATLATEPLGCVLLGIFNFFFGWVYFFGREP